MKSMTGNHRVARRATGKRKSIKIGMDTVLRSRKVYMRCRTDKPTEMNNASETG